MKEGSPYLKEWLDEEDDVCFAWTSSGPYSSPCLQAACPSKLSPVLSAEKTSQQLIKESLLFLQRKVAFIFLKGY